MVVNGDAGIVDACSVWAFFAGKQLLQEERRF